jgi:(S)-mandelate dehydrogenase
MTPRRALNVEDWRRLAHRRLPAMLRDYLDGGAEDDLTLRENRAAFGRIAFMPRTLVDVSRRCQVKRLLGREYASPFGIAPVGAAALYWHDGDIALARAARAANVPFVRSSHSLIPLERLVREAGAAPWYQLYMHKERAATERAVMRAADAGCDVLVLTTDVPVGGNREYNERNGFGLPLKLGTRQLLDVARHPRWVWSVLAPQLGRRARWLPAAEWGTRRDAATWKELSWVRERWPGKLLVKGVLSPEDARLAAERGADGVIVSNHGGRQLDGAPATIELLPSIVAEVEGRIAVLLDGGFRRGSDIVKALALGADMVLLGRAPMYGLAAFGERGVARTLEILRTEVDRVLALLGSPDIADLGPHHLYRAPGDRRQMAATNWTGTTELWTRRVRASTM